MKSFGVSDKGKVRKDNQDSFVIKECGKSDCLILAMCDGMGGARAGGIASELAKRAFSEYLYAKLSSRVKKKPDIHQIIRNACIEANEVVWSYSQFDNKYAGMGTTIVGCLVEKSGQVTIANIGDSRAYILSKKRNAIRQITVDHSYVEELVRKGLITRERAKTHPKKNMITRAIGTDKSVLPDIYEEKLAKGDVLLVCSDGLTNYVADEEIFDQYLDDSDPQNLCEALLSMAYFNGAGDNVTIIAVEK